MNQHDDRRLIEDYLPIEAISAEASREKSIRKGHISTLHLWWARRPLVACRAAVYGALVPADRWVKEVELKEPPADAEKAERVKNGKKKGLNRKAAKEFVTKLCRYPKTNPTTEADIRVKRETEAAIAEAQRHILEAHAERLTAELAEALKLPSPACGRGAGGEGGSPPGEGWPEGAPGWLNEFKWPRDKTAVTYDDIVAGRAPRPRALDMFAGGGAIPLEALRLGCEAYALDLNPVAHIIQLCTLVYPQKYGKPDPTARGMTGPPAPLAPNGERGGGEGVKPGESTWGGLAAEVRYWGNWVLDRVRKEIGDLYPPIPDPEVWSTPPEIDFDRQTGAWKVVKEGKLKRGVRLDQPAAAPTLLADDTEEDEDDEATSGGVTIPLPPGFLQPVAYLWTRTVRCKNPSCAATVPLVRQTWLCKKKGRYVALKMIAPRGAKSVRFEVVESITEKGLGFDPAGFSKGGNATCPFCGTVADNNYVKSEGQAGRLAQQLMAIVCTRPGKQGKVYVSVEQAFSLLQSTGKMPVPPQEEIQKRIEALCARTGLTVPSEPIEANPRSMDTQHFGFRTWGDLFTARQMLCLLSFAAAVREAHQQMVAQPFQAVPDATQARKPVPPDQQTPRSGYNLDRAKAVVTYLGGMVDKLADFCSTQCVWNYTGGRGVKNSFGRQALPMTWDFSETSPFNMAGASWAAILEDIPAAIDMISEPGGRPTVLRGSATALPWAAASGSSPLRGGGTGFQPVLFDAIITDPPYYDNVSYSNLSDFFYVWLKRTIGHLYPEHFASEATPKKVR